jgi:hypothetical protein
MKTTSFACLTLSALLGLTFVATASFAQERTAGGSLQAEASWTALQTLIGKVQGDVAINKIDIEAIKNCARLGKVWNPDKGCSDSDLLEKVLDCGEQNKVYNRKTNSCYGEAPQPTPVETYRWVGRSFGSTGTWSEDEEPQIDAIKKKLKASGYTQAGSQVAGSACTTKGEAYYAISLTSRTVQNRDKTKEYQASASLRVCE